MTEEFYEIRPMRDEDGPRILEIFAQGIKTKQATFDSEVPSWEQWDTTHHRFGRVVLLNASDTVLGWAAIKPTSNRACFSGVAEVSIYLDTNYLGRGIGKILLKKLILESESNGIWTLQSGIFPENKASLALHEKCGFRVVGIRSKVGKMEGKWRDIVLLEKRSDIIF